MKNLGMIALDIDGTVTCDNTRPIKDEVAEFLESLVQAGWKIVFITGRTFSRTYPALSRLTFPFYLGVQNGALVVEMPNRNVLFKHYLSMSIIEEFEEVCREEPTDFVLYAGYEHDDICYYRESHFCPELLGYLMKRTKEFEENWVLVDSFSDLNIEGAASVKCFGTMPSLQKICAHVEKALDLHIPIIKDPFGGEIFLAQGTAAHVNKGETLKQVHQILGGEGRTIGCGDDWNDISMLDAADIKVVMATAPDAIKERGAIIAPPASEMGIIQGLQEAIGT